MRAVTDPPADAPDPERHAILEELPGIVDGRGRKALYVGANAQRAFLLGDLLRWGWGTTILEIRPPNAVHVRDALGLPVVVGDVATSPLQGPYGLALWRHGPEHVHPEYLPQALASLEAAADLVVLGCPAGIAPQGPCLGNPFERHLSEITPDRLLRLGYRVRVDPRPNHPPNILAWRGSAPTP
jgi:hypothetical protein